GSIRSTNSRVRGFGFRCSAETGTPKTELRSGSLQLHIPVRAIQEGLPGPVLLLRQLQVQHRAPPRLFRLADQAHVRLLGRAAALADVAAHAGADDVLPGAGAALAARQHVVQAQFRGRELLAAVLALVVVAGEDV